MITPPFVKQFVYLQHQQKKPKRKIWKALKEMGYATTMKTVYKMCKKLDNCIPLTDQKPPGQPNPHTPKAKHPYKVHVWGAISKRGPTPCLIFTGIMDAGFYTEKILGNTLSPFLPKMYPSRRQYIKLLVDI